MFLNYIGKDINFHKYMNCNENTNMFKRDKKTSLKSWVGPIKAKFIRQKSFEPY